MMISLLRRCIQVHVHTVLMLMLLMMQVIHLLLLLHGQVSHVRMGVAWVHGHHKGMVRMRMWLLAVPHQIVGCREEAVSRGVGRMGRWRVIVVVAPADTEMGLRKIIRGHSVTHKQVRVGSRGCRTVAPATVVIIIKTHCRFGVHFWVSQFHICCFLSQEDALGTHTHKHPLDLHLITITSLDSIVHRCCCRHFSSDCDCRRTHLISWHCI